MAQDRRADIEAAFDTLEKQNEATQVEGTEVAQSTEVPAEAGAADQNTEVAQSTDEHPAGAAATEQSEVTPEQEATAQAVDDAPQAWKAPLKAKWATIDPEVRQEIQRREKDVTRVLSETASARQISTQLREIVTPFAARLQTMGVHPLQAFQHLLAADHQLATGTKQVRAQAVAKLIKDYDVDIGTLDEVLSGQTNPAAKDEERIARLLDQHLTPVKQQLLTYQQREQQEQQAQERAFEAEITAMSSNVKEYPHFSQVRDAMADLIEISVRRGVSLDLKTAYNRAVAADPQLSAQVESARQRAQLEQVAQKAQRAKAASLSVNGAPSAGVARNNPLDRRATIAAAFEALGG